MKRDFAPWLLLPSVVLTLSAVSFLAPRHPAQAAPPAVPKSSVADDGDGDELLEHWGDPKYSSEERTQLAGIAMGFLVLSTVAASTRVRRTRSNGAVPLPIEAELPKRDSSATNHRKAA